MSEELYVPDTQPSEHRAGAWVVLLVGVLGMGFGMFHWRSNVLGAFATNVPKYKSTDQIEQERLEALKSKDTDGDGLNDFEESYVFKTSPYLTDSDSDGKTDRDELTAGSDPGCPEGRECGPLGGGAMVVTSAPDELGEAPTLDDVERLQNLSPPEIRALLLESGVAAAELEGIDDATLMSLYRQSLIEAQGSETAPVQGETPSTGTVTPQAPPPTAPSLPPRPPAEEGDEDKKGEEN